MVIGSTVWRFYQRNCCRLEGLACTSNKSDQPVMSAVSAILTNVRLFQHGSLFSAEQ
jgi:hypothetical protein